MPKLYTINNTLVSVNGYCLGQYDRYDVSVSPSEHGTVVATPTRGLTGTTITLSSTPDSGYELDYYTVNGVAIVGNTFTLTGNVTVAGVFAESGDPYNPLGLPSNTVRVRTSDGNAPIKSADTSYDTATLVTGTSNVYDVVKNNGDMRRLLQSSTNVIEVLGANTTGVTRMRSMFDSCTALTTVPVFDTTSVTNTTYMFNYCSSLITVPLFDLSACNNVTSMFAECINVESGALALYQRTSRQTTPPYVHDYCFSNCGSNTFSGELELSQIPSDWGGKGE